METQLESDYVDFNKIRDYMNILDNKLFIVYLKDIYYDLSERTEINKKGISKITFLDYMKLPIFIGEKLFKSLDKDDDSFLSLNEFVEGLSKIYLGNFENSIEAVFSIYDFDKDDFIYKHDVRILLSHLPLLETEYPLQFKIQMDSLEEIDEILESTFEYKERLTLREFIFAIENKKSDIFLQLLCFLYQKRPFNECNVNKLSVYRNKEIYLQNESIYIFRDKLTKFLPSSNKHSLLYPAEAFLSFNLSNSDYKKNGNCILPDPSNMVRMPKHITVNKFEDRIENVFKNRKNEFNSPSTLFKKTKIQGDVSDFTISHYLIKINLEDDKENYDSKIKNSQSNTLVEYENWVYKLSESLNLKKYWLVLTGQEIFYYKSPRKEELLVMHNLSGCILKENGEKKIGDKIMFGFSIHMTGKIRNYYCDEENSYKILTKNLKESIGYLNFFEHYTILQDIGEGKFGKVKLGISNKTKEKVAIKLIGKESLNNSGDIELVKSEIDIMRLCKHPNVIRLLDHFENNEYIFIVMEYLQGGDLGEYLLLNKFNISEKRAANLMLQLANAVKYLHQYGIVHRDLKPDNVMLTDNSEDAIVKVMDFGLSKIVGARERLEDGFGSLSFVSPEILMRKPYDNKIDIWSLGIILFQMLSGSLPFDDKDDNEELIAKMIVFSEIEFKHTIWKSKSLEARDLISKCLIKEPENRISVISFINHEWIKNYI